MDHPVMVGTVGKFPQVQYIFDVNPFRESVTDRCLIPVDQFHNAASNCAESEYCDLYHNCSSFLTRKELRPFRLFSLYVRRLSSPDC